MRKIIDDEGKMSMKRRFKKTIRSVIISFLVVGGLLQSPAWVYAETPVTISYGEANTFTLEDFGQSTDDTYEGVLVSRDYAINLPATWEYRRNAVLNLKISHSPSLNEKSTMAVDWNSVRVGSVALTTDNVNNGILEIEIPASDIIQGYNILHVEFYMGIADDFCEDMDNPAVWAVVHKSTSLTLYPLAASPDLDLNVLPTPFVDSSPLMDNQITLIVPDNPGAGDLNALAAVSAALGSISEGWKPLDVQTLNVSSALSQKPEGNLVMIGEPGELNKLTTAVNVDMRSGSGILAEVISPFDPTALLLAVSGVSQADVEKAGWALTSEDLYPRLSGSSVYVLDLPQSNGSQTLNGSAFTLEKLGYTDMAVYGSRDQQVSYAIPLNALWQENSSAELDLHFIHSSLLAGDQFTLTVSVNDLPVGSVVIHGGDSSDKHETFLLPLSFFEAGVNYLYVQSSIQLSDDFSDTANYCMNDHYNRAWLTIANDSQVSFPTSPDQISANIASFPYTYFGASDLSQLAFVLPDRPDLADVQALTALAVRIGQAADGSSLMPHVLTAEQAAEQEDQYPYQILVGKPLQNAAILAAADKLPQPFDPGSGEALPVADLSTIDTSQIGTGYIEVFLADNGIPRMVVTGNNDKGLLLAAGQLEDATKTALLIGDLAVTTSTEQAASLWVSQEAEDTTTISKTDQDERTVSSWFQLNGVTYTALGILILTLLILIIQLILSMKKDRTEG